MAACISDRKTEEFPEENEYRIEEDRIPGPTVDRFRGDEIAGVHRLLSVEDPDMPEDFARGYRRGGIIGLGQLGFQMGLTPLRNRHENLRRSLRQELLRRSHPNRQNFRLRHRYFHGGEVVETVIEETDAVLGAVLYADAGAGSVRPEKDEDEPHSVPLGCGGDVVPRLVEEAE